MAKPSCSRLEKVWVYAALKFGMHVLSLPEWHTPGPAGGGTVVRWTMDDQHAFWSGGGEKLLVLNTQRMTIVWMWHRWLQLHTKGGDKCWLAIKKSTKVNGNEQK